MNTFTTASIAGLFALSFTANANSATLADMLAESATAQLTELSVSIKQQAAIALENTAAELFFSIGSNEAAKSVSSNDKTSTRDVRVAVAPEKE